MECFTCFPQVFFYITLLILTLNITEAISLSIRLFTLFGW